MGPRDMAKRGGAVSFVIDGVHPHDVSTIVDGHGVAIRAGHHCAQLLMRRFNVPATNRASFALYNTPEEIDVLIEALNHAVEVFADGSARTAV
jgi:cysteine desulfurase / selenocysteine lyase